MSSTAPKREADVATQDDKIAPRQAFGVVAPWSEPAWYNNLHSPYYDDSHRRLRAYVRRYFDEHVLPHQFEWEERGDATPEARLHFTRSGISLVDVPIEYRPKEMHHIGDTGLRIDQLDAFHMLVLTDEGSRVQGGVNIALAGANAIGIPPVINHGTPAQKQRWLPGLFDLSTSFCLGITEPTGGSDVSNIRTTATKTADGKHYIVNGHKKWITGSPWASHMTTAVRTGGPGILGISLLVIPLRDPESGGQADGISLRKIQNSGQNAGGSSWVTLEDVKVPAENLLGQENAGFMMIMTNFNKERFIMSVACNRKARQCLQHALQYAHDRETFGKPLVAHQIIRHKLTEMARKVESHWAWLEQLAYHIGKEGWQSSDVAGRIALCKVSGGRLLEFCAREAQQIFGGAGYQKGGVGGVVEQINRDLRMMVVGGGSEEIIGDLAFRQETKLMKKLGSKI